MNASVFKTASALVSRSVVGQRAALHTARPLFFKATVPKPLFGDNVPNPATVPKLKANRMQGSYHWMNERALSLISIPLIATSVFYGAQPINDMLLGIVIPIHAYIGFESVLTDYFHKRRWHVIGPALKYALVFITGLSIFGAWRINTTDVGITNYISRLWNANKKNQVKNE